MSVGKALEDFTDFVGRILGVYKDINVLGQAYRGLGSLVPKTPDFPLPESVEKYLKEDVPVRDIPLVTQGTSPQLGPSRQGAVLSQGGFFRTPTQKTSKSMQAGRYSEGGSVLDETIKPLFKAILENGLEEGVASYLGISQKDTDWASSIGDRYGLSPSKRDAARHVALGWLASKTDTPELAKFFADAREFRPIAGGPIVSRRMDLENNDIGYNLPAKDKNQAEIMILDLVEKGQVNTDDPSGYAEGGGVGSLAPMARNMYKIPSIKRGVGSYISHMRR
jgi:hypothetical protein